MVICMGCGGNVFKKEYKSEYNVEIYCTKCGLILKKDDLVDEYNDNRWLNHGFRPNSWNICYVNHIVGYFKEIHKNIYELGEINDDDSGGYSRKPDLKSGYLYESECFQEGIISYEKYLQVNSFRDNDESKLKYLRRYKQKGFNKCLEYTNNRDIIKKSNKKDVNQPKYNYEKWGGGVNNHI